MKPLFWGNVKGEEVKAYRILSLLVFLPLARNEDVVHTIGFFLSSMALISVLPISCQ